MNQALKGACRPVVLAALPLAALLLAAGSGHAKPPTLDPTFGRPLPAKKTVAPQAQCIWASTVNDHQTVYLRRTFLLGVVPKTVRLAVVADDFCAVTLNGRHIALPPSPPGSYGVAEVTDVAPMLVTGKNVVAVTAVNGIGAAAVLLRLDTEGRSLALSGPDWKATASPPPAGWSGAQFDDAAWKSARVIGPAFGGPWGGGVKGWPAEDAAVPYLSDIFLRPVRVEALPGAGAITGGGTLIGPGPIRLVIRPAPAGTADPASLVLDFGREVAGRMQVKGPDGAQVRVATGESREECLKAPWGGSSLLTLQAGATQSTPDSAFRYVRLSFSGTAPFVISDVTMDDVYYPVRYQGTFDCSDPLLTKIWYTGAYTAHLGMQQDLYDGPKRDRLLWSGDMQVSGEVINTVFADHFLMERDLALLRAGIQAGKPAEELPSSEINSIPGYSAAWFCTLADFYRHSGDEKFLRSQHALIVSLLRFQQTDFDGNNLYTNPHRVWDFVDWSSGLSNWNPEGRFEDSPEAQTATNLFLIHGVREAVFLLRAIGDGANAEKYEAWAGTLTAAARKRLVDPQSGTYTARRQDNIMAVLSGVATPAQQNLIYASILKAGSPDWKQEMTPYYGCYLLTAYSRLGHTLDALDYARRFWGGMIAQGGTTFWERYNTSWPFAGPNLVRSPAGGDYEMSLCHAWSSGVTSWLTECVLGIRPTSGGFRTVVIAPDLGDLRWAAGDVPTPHGMIHVRVTRTGRHLACRVTLPPGTVAYIRLPGKTQSLHRAGIYLVESDERLPN